MGDKEYQSEFRNGKIHIKEVDYSSYGNNKEYEGEFKDGKLYISEVDNTPYEYTTDLNPTRREMIAEKLEKMPRGKRLFQTFFFDLYGFKCRFSSNRALAVVFSIFQMLGFLSMLSQVFTIVLTFSSIEDLSSVIPAIMIYIRPFLLSAMPFVIPWLIDIISVVFTNEIKFLGRIKYKNYQG